VGGIVLLLLIMLIASVIALAVAFSSGGGADSGPTVYEEEYVSGTGADRVAVIPVQGVIAAGDPALGGVQPTVTPEGLADALGQAEDDASVVAVVLEVNSPGGGVTASDEMHQSIVDFQDRTDKPVVVSMGDTAASGGYYISAPADAIVANKTTFTGSLGAIITLTNVSGLAEDYGVEQEVIKSGEFKGMGSSFRELTPQEREILQSIVDESYAEFVDVISQGRDIPEDRVRKIADGRIYSGEQARELGLVDEFGGLDEAARLARERARVDRATVIRYVQTPGLFDTVTARLAPREPEAIQVLRAIGLDPTPKVQYLYRPGV
jgi:protease-4